MFLSCAICAGAQPRLQVDKGPTGPSGSCEPTSKKCRFNQFSEERAKQFLRWKGHWRGGWGVSPESGVDLPGGPSGFMHLCHVETQHTVHSTQYAVHSTRNQCAFCKYFVPAHAQMTATANRS